MLACNEKIYLKFGHIGFTGVKLGGGVQPPLTKLTNNLLSIILLENIL
jgi:hypothetical protein